MALFEAGSHRRRLLLCLVGAALVRLALAFAPVDWLDVRFVPDDTYYTLSIARSLAEGKGPSADGVTLTTGFQPLLAFLLVPVLAIFGTSDAVLRVLWVGLACVDVASVALLARLARRIAGDAASSTTAILWGASPVAIGAALSGMEATLALCASLLVVELWCRALESRSGWIPVGIACGMTLLARVDTGLLIGILGGWELVRGERRGVVLAALVAALVVLPWWGWSVAHFGTFVPESGPAVRALAFLWQDEPFRTAFVWAAGNILFGPSLEPGNVRLVFLFPAIGEVLAIATAVLFAFLGTRMLRLPRRPHDRPVRAFLLHGALLPVLYVVLVPGAWFFHRYFLPTTAATALCWGVLLGGAAHPLARVARWLLPIVGMLSFAIAKGPGHRPEEVGAIEGPVGYLAAMREAVAQVPPGAVVGSMQSGALSWVAPPRVRAVNLDGVVDRESFEALRDARLDDVLVAREVDYFVDWPLQSRVLVERSARPVRLETVWTYEARMCSNHEVILSRVVVPGR